jgi:hypothetical protein
VLVEECTRSIVNYFRDHGDEKNPWLRSPHIEDRVPILTPEPVMFEVQNTRKICQITGEFDLEGWTRNSSAIPAIGRRRSHHMMAGCSSRGKATAILA